MVDLAFRDDSFQHNRSWDDSGITISGIDGNHKKYIGSKIPFTWVGPLLNSRKGPCWWQTDAKIIFLFYLFSRCDVVLINKPPAGLYHTEAQSGDAPKPHFEIKSIKRSWNSRNQHQINHWNYQSFLSLPCIPQTDLSGGIEGPCLAIRHVDSWGHSFDSTYPASFVVMSRLESSRKLFTWND